ncbi:IKI3 family-domain-containing protein [Lipomyces arxii]|uniref:IKI3 family-domain-containing protein n=1 Tax=Lipomyces arxii TaxID=56418 RepID=UPI0034CF2E2B
MWNLLQTQRSRVTVESVSAPDLPLTKAFFNVVNNSLICLLGPSDYQYETELQEIKPDGTVKLLAAWFTTPLAEDSLPSGLSVPEGAFGSDRVIDLHFFPDSNNAVIVMAGGEIVNIEVDEDPEGEGNVTVVGSVDEGFTAASWSPDEEILALTTGAKSLILLSRQFDQVADFEFSAKDITMSSHVSVGWGKKETQFEGKGVKGRRDPTLRQAIDEGVLSIKDDSQTRISWRGDGAYLCVNSVDTVATDIGECLRRTIRVFSRDGVLDSVSEPVDGLESFVSWRPSGNLIASVQRIVDGERRGLDVVFFERNGLRRGEFKTRLLTDETILDVQWNVDSTVLAILLSNRIQFWTVNNYYWYLKQELYLTKEEPMRFMRWHTERPLTLILGQKDFMEIFEFASSLYTGSKAPPNDSGVLMVADGKNLKITPLKIANTPPPMAFRTLELASSSAHASINVSNDLIAVLEHSEIELAQWSLLGSKSIATPTVTKSIPLTELDLVGIARQLRFISRNVLAVLFDYPHYSRVSLLKFNNDLEYDIVFTHDFEASVVTMAPRTDHRAIGIELANADVWEICSSSDDGETYEITVSKILQLPERCLTVGDAIVGDKIYVFGLASNGRLYANQQRISVSCTSFIVTENYLLYTTAQNFLKFVHLTAGDADLDVVPDAANDDERSRAIERGGKIVSIMPSKVAVVLQMPRGNLETIYPRLLVLEGVRRNIEKRDYLEAFKACRIHRVNLDILYDYDPQLFMDNVEMFVKALGKVDYLDLFMSGLTNEDVTKTIYKATMPTGVDETAMASLSLEPVTADKAMEDHKSKINRICDAILGVLLQSYSKSHTQSIITAYVCKHPPDIEAALTLIANFGHDDQENLTRAIEHICFLQDVNKLYDYALGIYDLRLALLIARQSQKDPREYLPFINDLQNHVPLRRRFLLDEHLGRHAKALTHLTGMKYDDDGKEIFPEVERFIVKHVLYKNALQIYKYEPIKQYAILTLFAKYLKQNGEFKEAGLAYELLGDYNDALDSYVLGTHWREALAVCSMANSAQSDVHDVSLKLAEALLEARQYKDSATVYLEYCRDLKEAVLALCKGFFYSDAIRIILQQNTAKFIHELLEPALVDGFNTISELLSDCRGQLNAQIERLRELRVKKLEDPMSYFEGAEESDIPDNVSIAPSEMSTSASLFTRYTGKTAGTAQTGASRKTVKNRRREERKRARGKKGSVYEEEYLINSIGRLIDRINETRGDGRRLVEGLMRRGMRERALEIQRRYVELVGSLNMCVGEVYTISERDRQRYDDEGNMYLAPELPVPKVEDFEKMEILDYD